VLPRNTKDHEANIKALIDSAANSYAKSKRARTYKDRHIADAQASLDNAKRYHKIMFPRRKWKHVDLDGLAEQAEAARKREAKRAKREQAKLLKELAGGLENWKNHEPCPRYGTLYQLPVALRLTPDSDKVETSHGAEVPVPDARKLFKVCQACRKKGEAYVDRETKIGIYSGIAIDKKGNAKVGCHDLSYEEMNRINEILKGEKA